MASQNGNHFLNPPCVPLVDAFDNQTWQWTIYFFEINYIHTNFHCQARLRGVHRPMEIPICWVAQHQIYLGKLLTSKTIQAMLIHVLFVKSEVPLAQMARKFKDPYFEKNTQWFPVKVFLIRPIHWRYWDAPWHMVLAYLPAELDHFWGKMLVNIPSYSSTMEYIWEWVFRNIQKHSSTVFYNIP
jgi:hypothetical protein